MARIMVVDDDENTLKALRRELRAAGAHEVETYTSPELALAHARSGHFDLLISDYRMPWMHGLTLVRRFMRLQPHAGAIVISGDAERALSHSEFDNVRIPCLLRKPWQTAELLDSVARALQGGGP